MNKPQQDNHDKQTQQFGVQRIYIKDCSVESPLGAAVFTKPWKPHVDLNLNVRNTPLNDGQYEVILTATITLTLENETAFLVEVQQAGLFIAQNLQEDQLHHALGVAGPTILFPYLREAVDNLTLKAGFPAINIQPIHFEALHAQAAAEKQAATSVH